MRNTPCHPYKRHSDLDLPHNWLCCNRLRWLCVCNHYQLDCKHIHLGIRRWTNGRTEHRKCRIANNLLDLYGNVTSVLDYWISICRKVSVSECVCVWHKQHSRISSTDGRMAEKRAESNETMQIFTWKISCGRALYSSCAWCVAFVNFTGTSALHTIRLTWIRLSTLLRYNRLRFADTSLNKHIRAHTSTNSNRILKIKSISINSDFCWMRQCVLVHRFYP